MNRLITLLFIAISSSLFGQTGSTTNAFGELKSKTYVIIIGASEYESFPKLDYSDDDAILMKNYWETHDNTYIKTFINSTALSKDSIGAEIDITLNSEAKSGDNVIIFFSGHGDVDPKYNDGYLILPNAQLPSARTYKYNSTLSMGELDEMISFAAKQGVNVMLITDACKSGSILNARDANQRMLEVGNNTVSIVSCGPTESSFESPDLEKGLFTFYLVQGLKGLADQNGDKNVTYLELLNYLAINVSEEAKNLNQNNQQSPSLRASNMMKPVAKVEPALLAEAQALEKEIEKKQFNKIHNSSNDDLAIAKGLSNDVVMSPTSSYLLQMMQSLVSKNLIFSDQVVNTNNQSITAGLSDMTSVSSSPVYSVSVSSDGNYIAAPSNNDVAIYGKKMNLLFKMKGHKGGVTVVAFRPGTSHVVSGSWDNSAILWNAQNGSKIQTSPKLSDEAYGIAFIDANTAIIGTNSGDLYKWDVTTNKTLVLKLGKSRISAVEVVGKFVFVAMRDGTIRVIDPANMSEVKSFNAHKGGVNGLAFSPLKNELLSVGDDKALKIWNATTYGELKSIDLDFNDNRDVDIDPFGTYAFVSSRRYDMDVINLSTERTSSHFLSSHSSGLVSVHFNQTSNEVLIGDSKGRIHRNGVVIDQAGYAALDIYDMLLKSDDAATFQYRFDATILMGLNKLVYTVLNPLVNGEPILPSVDEILMAKKYAKKAQELGGKSTLEKRKLEINALLLEVFEIVQGKKDDQYSAALEKVKRIETLDPNGAYALNISGALLAKLNKLNEAKGKAAQAEELAPLWAEAPCGTGKILFQEGNYELAEIKFKETIEKGAELSKGYYNLAKLYNHIGRLTEAKELCDKAESIDKEVPEIALISIENAFLLGDYKHAKVIAKRAFMSNVPGAIVAANDVEYLERGANTQYQELYDSYKKAYDLDSNNIDAINGLAYFYIRTMNDDKASKFVESTFASKEGDRAIKGATMMKRECKRLFNRAEKLDKMNLRTTIGDWMTRGSEVSAETVNNAIQRHHESADVYAAIGRFYIFKEDYKNAIKYLKLGTKADDKNVSVIILTLEANKLAGKEKKNAPIISKLTGDSKQAEILKYRKELTSYMLLY